MSNGLKEINTVLIVCFCVCLHTVSVCVCVCVFRYEIILKQSVGTEDLFLGLNGKDPSSMCCEAMLVTYQPPHGFYTSLTCDTEKLNVH